MKYLFKLFKIFAKLLNATRLVIINSIFLGLLIIVIVAITSSDDEQVIVPDNGMLELNFNGSIVEQSFPLDFSSELSKQLTGSNDDASEYPLDEILQVIDHAQKDPKIKTILLDLGGLKSASLNQITAIGNALDKFKQSDKNVIATADSYSQIQYLLASHANTINMDPQGIVMLQGFSVYRLYFKELLDKLLITPHIFKVGTYKSYVEPYTESKMSDASKMANSHWLNQLWQGYIDTVLTQRKDTNITAQSISPTLKQLKLAMQKAQGNSALYAQQAGLVDQLIPRFKVLNALEESGLESISYARYQSTMPTLYPSNPESDQIALIYGQGEILAGSQNSGAIGGDSFSELLDNALNDDNIKAVVLRLDTPGGSAFASEKIRQHILALKNAGKKVVVSMGSVSASGGYWISSAADHIVASPSTLTGSIGIFGMFASADKALNSIGIYNDGVATSPLSSLNPTRPLDPDLADIMQLGIENGYKQFLTVVAEGRGMSVEAVDKVAQGRVWTGTDAKSLGLVDQLGNLQDAISTAAELADLTDYTVTPLTEEVSTKQQLINEILSTSIKIVPQGIQLNSSLFSAIDTVQEQASVLTSFNDPKGQYAYCPMCSITH